MDYFYYLWLLSYIATTVTLVTLFVKLVSKCFANPASIEGKHVLVSVESESYVRCRKSINYINSFAYRLLAVRVALEEV